MTEVVQPEEEEEEEEEEEVIYDEVNIAFPLRPPRFIPSFSFI